MSFRLVVSDTPPWTTNTLLSIMVAKGNHAYKSSVALKILAAWVCDKKIISYQFLMTIKILKHTNFYLKSGDLLTNHCLLLYSISILNNIVNTPYNIVYFPHLYAMPVRHFRPCISTAFFINEIPRDLCCTRKDSSKISQSNFLHALFRLWVVINLQPLI